MKIIIITNYSTKKTILDFKLKNYLQIIKLRIATKFKILIVLSWNIND